MTIYKNKKEVKIVSKPCGTGKTHSLGSVIKENLSKSDIYKKNHLILLPSLHLVNQVKSDFQDIHHIQNIVEITSNTKNSVAKDAMDFFKEIEGTGNVVLMTYQGFQNVPYFHQKENWEIYVDEIPQVDQFFPFIVPYNSSHITDYLEISEPENENLGIIQIKERCRKKLQEIVDRPFDIVDKKFLGLYRSVLSDSQDVFVDMESWYRVFERGDIDDSPESMESWNNDVERDSGNKVFFLSMLNPNSWDGVTLLSANIENSMLYDWFGRYHGVEFSDNEEIISKFSKERENNNLGKRLKVQYFRSDKGFSKYFAKQEVEGTGQDVLSIMDNKVKKEFQGKEFLYICNNDHQSEVLDDVEGLKKIPVISHGMNDSDHISNIYFSASLNREHAHLRMLNQLGFDRGMVRDATVHEIIYQNVMRTSLRDSESQETVSVIVPDEFSADRLVSLFKGSVKKRIGDELFNEYAPLTPQDYNRKSQFKKRLDKLFNKDSGCIQTRSSSEFDSSDVRSSPQTVNLSGSNLNYSKSLDSSYLIEKPNLFQSNKTLTSRVLSLTFHQDKKAKYEEDFIVAEDSPLEVIKFLKQSSKVIVKNKDEVSLVNSTIFDPSLNTGGYRRKDNFVESSMMILDFDDGELSPEQFERIFWTNAGRGNKRSFIICNSFSRSEMRPNNFRVFIFYKESAKSLVEHFAVYDSIVQRLELNNYYRTPQKDKNKKLSGLDPQCRNGNQSFYLPCVNRNYEESAFFRKYGLGGIRDIEKYGIVPASYMKTSVIPFERPIVRKVSSVKRPVIDINQRITEIKSDVIILKDTRRHPFYLAGVEMKKLGLSYSEIQTELQDLSRTIGKSQTNWVSGTLKSLRNYKKGFNRETG